MGRKLIENTMPATERDREGELLLLKREGALKKAVPLAQ